jgi:hypothetical protein
MRAKKTRLQKMAGVVISFPMNGSIYGQKKGAIEGY